MKTQFACIESTDQRIVRFMDLKNPGVVTIRIWRQMVNLEDAINHQDFSTLCARWVPGPFLGLREIAEKVAALPGMNAVEVFEGVPTCRGPGIVIYVNWP